MSKLEKSCYIAKIQQKKQEQDKYTSDYKIKFKQRNHKQTFFYLFDGFKKFRKNCFKNKNVFVVFYLRKQKNVMTCLNLTKLAILLRINRRSKNTTYLFQLTSSGSIEESPIAFFIFLDGFKKSFEEDNPRSRVLLWLARPSIDFFIYEFKKSLKEDQGCHHG